jgi:proline iminopeptidase
MFFPWQNEPTLAKHVNRILVSFVLLASSPLMNTEKATETMSSALRTLYPEIEPYRVGKLPVSPLHTLYFEECGNPAGQPVVFLHGGPGGGCSVKSRRFFDPLRYRIVMLDQRGAGRSTPYAELTDNTTWHLVSDIEVLRTHLGIERWHVFGGSWGSTLALAYAQTHPQRVSALMLRGIFMLRRWELEWFYQKGADAIFPDAWEHFLAAIPKAEQGDLMSAYYRRLTSPDKAVQLAAARAWSVWEGSTSYLMTDPGYVALTDSAEFAIAFARIEAHYFVHGGFMQRDDQLLANVDRIRHIPAVIVQGRYDVVCPMRSAWDLHCAWPQAQFVVVADAGHSAMEVGITSALVQASDDFAS